MMKSRAVRWMLVIVILAIAPDAGVQAQFAGNNQTNTISGVTNNVAGGYHVGLSFVGDVLQVLNGGVLSNGFGTIGNNSNASNNTAIVRGPGSLWGNVTYLNVGSNGSANALLVTNGGSVRVGTTLVIGYGPSASNNIVRVTGGSIGVTNSGGTASLVAGLGGHGQLILDPGTLTANFLWVTNGSSSSLTFNGGALTSFRNTVSNGQVFVIGNGTDAATYKLTGGTHAFANGVVIRNNATLTGCGTVDGPVLVEAGGTVTLSDCWEGLNFTGVMTNNGTLQVENGTVLSCFGPVINNGQVITTNGFLAFYSSFENNGTYLTGDNNWSSPTGGKWENAGNWSVGVPNVGNTTVSLANPLNKTVTLDAATTNTPASLTIRRLRVAGTTNTINTLQLDDMGPSGSLQAQNIVTAEDRGVIAVNRSRLVSTYLGVYLGNTGSEGELIITNGGIVQAPASLMGVYASSSNNFALVRDSGSLWTNADSIYIGYSGSGNQLIITNGASARNLTGNIGYRPESTDNFVLVTGTGSVWRQSGCIVGTMGSDNQMTIADGGTAVAANGYIGINASGRRNCLVVTDPGSLWTNSVASYVGYGGSDNLLIITNGGRVAQANASLGVNVDSSGNVAVVTGAGSTWNNSVALYIGFGGPRNQISILNSGLVTTAGGYVGYDPGASNNLLLVSGPGSRWNNSATHHVGFVGPNNQMIISNGGAVFNTFGYFGQSAGSTRNIAIVTGAGSVWSNASDLYLGYVGSSNQLIIADGGKVFSGSTTMSRNSGIGNQALITGSGSVWYTSSSLYVGFAGGDNQMVISNGGAIYGLGGVLGGNSASSNNVVLVTGTGSVWSNVGLTVGSFGTRNQLVIADDGLVTTTNLYISSSTSSISTNLIWVKGGKLLVTMSSGHAELNVGQTGLAHLLIDAGTVTADLLRLRTIESILTFNGGWLSVRSTSVTNNQQFVVGDGASSATYQLLGGVHGFKNGLRIRNAARLTGCGTVNAVVLIEAGGLVRPDCSPIVFGQNVTNNGVVRISEGRTLEVYGTFVNNGLLDLINIGLTNFHGAFINNGTVLDSSSIVVRGSSLSGNDYILQIQSVAGHAYQLQKRSSLTGPDWSDWLTPLSGTGGILTFIDPDGGTNQPGCFYRVRVTTE